jgi:predicted transcriptional regulator
MSVASLARRIASGESFGEALTEILEREGIKPAEFAKRAGVPYPTLYKILKGANPSYESLSRIFRALGKGEEFVALIAARYVVEEFEFDERVRLYPATTLEDAIVSAVRAEKDGAGVIICAPILSGLIERMVDIPVITIKPKGSITDAVEGALRRLERRV